MSYHVFPQAGREAYNPRRKFAAMQKLEPIRDTSGHVRSPDHAMVNTGWNDTALLPLDSTRHLLPPKMRTNETGWESPTINVLPTAASKTDLLANTSRRPFGQTSGGGTNGLLLQQHKLNASVRTPLAAVGQRSEHWYSNPIHGVFTEYVQETPERWVTSNRNVFAPRTGVPAPSVSASILQRVASTSSGSLQYSTHGFTRPQISRLQHCWDVHEAERGVHGF